MSIESGFKAAFAVLLAALALMTVALVLAKGLRQLLQARRTRLVTKVRPRVLATIGDDSTVETTFGGGRNGVVAAIVIALLPKMRGADRDALTRVLRAGGVIQHAMARLGSIRAARRVKAVELLGAAGVASSSSRLIEMLSDRNAGVRMAAARALGRIGATTAVAPLLAALDDRRVPANTVSMSILRIGAGGAPALFAACEAPGARTRAVAAELIGSLGLAGALPFLALMLDDASPEVREKAARSLGRLGVRKTAPMLIDRLEFEMTKPRDSRHGKLIVALASALGHLGDRSATPILRFSLTRSHRLSFTAASALARIGIRPGDLLPKQAAPGPVPTSAFTEIIIGRTTRLADRTPALFTLRAESVADTA